MKAEILDSSMRIMENKHSCNTFYVVLKVNNLFDYKCFVQVTKEVIKQLPIVRSYFQKGVWRDFWGNVDEEYDSFFVQQDIEIQGDDEEIELVNGFTNSNKKYLRCGIDHPIRFNYFKGKKKGLLVIAVHHTLCDGQPALRLISLIANAYKEMKFGQHRQNTTINIGKSNPVREIAKSYGNKNLLKMFVYMKPSDCIKDANNILQHECDYEKEVDRDRIVIRKSLFCRKDLVKIKEQFPQQDITLNDIFLCCGIKVVERFNREKNVNNRAIPISFNINLRRYISKTKNEVFFLSNVFAPQSIIHDLKSGSSYDSVMKTVKEIKSIPMGLPFYSMIHMMRFFPIVLVEKVVGGLLKEVNNQIYQGLSITNVGRLDSFLEGMEDVIEDANIIPTGGKIGFPSACITEYKEILSITFVKYNDEEKLIDIVQQYYEEELSKLMKGCNIYEE